MPTTKLHNPEPAPEAVDVNPEDAAQALEAKRAELEALDPAALKMPRSVFDVFTMVLSTLPSIATFLPELIKHGLRADLVVELRTRAFALYQADRLLAQTDRGRMNTVLPAMVAEALALRERFVAEVTAYAVSIKTALPAAVVVRIGASHAELANNLWAFVELFRTNWEGIAGKTRITLEDLAQAKHLTALIAAEKDGQGATLSRSDRPRLIELRRRAFTLLFLLWEDVRRALVFIQGGKAGGVTLKSLHAQGKRRSAKVDVSEEPKADATPSAGSAVAAAPKANGEVTPKAAREVTPKADAEVAPKAPVA